MGAIQAIGSASACCEGSDTGAHSQPSDFCQAEGTRPAALRMGTRASLTIAGELQDNLRLRYVDRHTSSTHRLSRRAGFVWGFQICDLTTSQYTSDVQTGDIHSTIDRDDNLHLFEWLIAALSRMTSLAKGARRQRFASREHMPLTAPRLSGRNRSWKGKRQPTGPAERLDSGVQPGTLHGKA